MSLNKPAILEREKSPDDPPGQDDNEYETGHALPVESAPDAGETGAVLSPDRKFELLKNQRRRHALRHLMGNGGTSTTSELAEQVAVSVNDKDGVNEISSKERKSVYVGLYQCHLPKMDKYGVIDFNRARGRIELTDRAKDLEEYLHVNRELPWATLYLGITVVGIVLFLGSSLAVGGLGPLLIAGVTYACILGLAGLHWQHQTG